MNFRKVFCRRITGVCRHLHFRCITELWTYILTYTFVEINQQKIMNMKKQLKAALVIGMVFLYANTFGQAMDLRPEKTKAAEKTAKTYLDLMVNVVSTNLNYGSSNSAMADYKKSVNGIQAGLSFQAGITHRFSLVSDLYFMRKGGKLTSNNPLSDNELTFRFYTIELPVLARVHFGDFYMNAGPSIAYNLSGTRKIDGLTTDLSFKNSSEGFKRFDAGVQIGGGYMFQIKEKRLALDVRYNYGLTNISHSNEMYNRSIMISMNYSKPWKTNPLGRNKKS